MGDNDLLYIEDAHNRKLYYHFTPAAVVSNFVPLVVILHDEEKMDTAGFEYKMWNVLTPLNHFETKDGNFILNGLLQKLIQQIAQEYECEDHIYMYGSCMGGYGAILHGILSKANAVYAHRPHIKLQNANPKESDLTNFLNPTDSFPIFYLCSNENNLEDETAYFSDTCKKNAINVHLDFCPKLENDRLKEVLNFFERVASQI